MGISVVCPKGHALNVKNEFAGKKGQCPHCGEVVSIPLVPQIDDSTDDDLHRLHCKIGAFDTSNAAVSLTARGGAFIESLGTRTDANEVEMTFIQTLAEELTERGIAVVRQDKDGSNAVQIDGNFVTINEGSQFLRNLPLSVFGRATIEVEGNVRLPGGIAKPFHILVKQGEPFLSMGGFKNNSSKGVVLLGTRKCAKILAKEVGRMVERENL